MKSAFFNRADARGNTNNIERIYGRGRTERIAALADLHPVVITPENFDAEAEHLRDLDVIFATWRMPLLTEEQLNRLPSLKAVFYAAGTVKDFARPLLDRKILVCNAVAANAVPVAEFCLAQILLSCKGFFSNVRLNHQEQTFHYDAVGKGVYGETVALVGIGEISRRLLELLKPFHLRIIAVSNYLQSRPEAARAMGIERLVTLEEAFRQAYVVSNHLPDQEANRGIITTGHFESMRESATFINTGRGAQVDEKALVDVLRRRPDLTALLDVTFPEPPESGSPLYTTPNILVSSHMAGSLNDEFLRMADHMIDDFERFLRGEPLLYAVDPDLCGRLA